MNEPETWTTLLSCGHDAHLRHELQPGQWITCTSLKCQGQRRITRVNPVCSVPAPGEIGVQGTLFEEAA